MIEPKFATLGEDVFRQMVDLICTFELKPGTTLNEAALAVRFGVSRGPIREAIRRLQGVQLVTREPYLKARVVKLSVSEVQGLFEMREALEGYTCRLACERMSDSEVASLISDLEGARQDYQLGRATPEKHDFDFHERIIRGSGNERLIHTLCGELYHLLRMVRRMSGPHARKTPAYLEHWQIVRALKARDPELAESLMRGHVCRAGEHIIARINAGVDLNASAN